MKRQKGREDGYVLGWVVIMVMVLTIFVMAILFTASAYYRQGLREYNQKQAYLTARSAAQTVAADFTGDGSGELRDAVMEELFGAEADKETNDEAGEDADSEADKENGEEGSNAPVPLSIITLQMDSDMGSCTVSGWFMPEDNCLALTAAAKKGGSTESVTVCLARNPEAEEDQWTILKYERGEFVPPDS